MWLQSKHSLTQTQVVLKVKTHDTTILIWRTSVEGEKKERTKWGVSLVVVFPTKFTFFWDLEILLPLYSSVIVCGPLLLPPLVASLSSSICNFQHFPRSFLLFLCSAQKDPSFSIWGAQWFSFLPLPAS